MSCPGTVTANDRAILSPCILKVSAKHVDNPFTLNHRSFLQSFKLYFMQVYVEWVLIIFETQVKKKLPVCPVFSDYLSFSYDYNFLKLEIRGKLDPSMSSY